LVGTTSIAHFETTFKFTLLNSATLSICGFHQPLERDAGLVAPVQSRRVHGGVARVGAESAGSGSVGVEEMMK
jgi:hypothetical protein